MDKLLCFVCSAAGEDNVNNRDDKTIFTIKDAKLYVPVVTLSARDNQKLSIKTSMKFNARNIIYQKA